MNQDDINPERKRRMVRLPLGKKVGGHRLKFNFRCAAHPWTRNSHARSSSQRSRLRDNCGRAVRIFGQALGEAAEVEGIRFKVDKREGGFTRRGCTGQPVRCLIQKGDNRGNCLSVRSLTFGLVERV